jgi:hypothetical protein
MTNTKITCHLLYRCRLCGNTFKSSKSYPDIMDAFLTTMLQAPAAGQNAFSSREAHHFCEGREDGRVGLAEFVGAEPA